MRPRRANGTSLIETLVIIVIGGIIATLAIKVLHQSQLNARQAQTWLDLQKGITRLEAQLRQDLREATEVQLPDDQTLVVQQRNTSVEYVKKENLIERTLTSPEMSSNQREGYRLPRCRVQFFQDDSRQVRLTIEANQGTPSSEEYVIEQAIGRRP